MLYSYRSYISYLLNQCDVSETVYNFVVHMVAKKIG